ncbi:MAG: sigma-70 family RNA polymerase sigma factor [Polyangiaceae bacterium]|nr:sigma-70 family RNA polymerase sigma factor [Polyangiaceae bacterium]
MAQAGVDAGDIEDVIQKTLEVAWAKRDQIDPTGNVLAWVIEIARNQARQHLRNLRRAPEVLVTYDEPQDDVEDERPGPEDSAERREQLEVLRFLLEQIHESRRAIFAEHALGEVPIADLAATHGIPASTVRKRLELARKDMCRAAKRWQAAQKGRGELAIAPFWPALAALELRAMLRRCIETLRRFGAGRPVIVAAAALLIGGCVAAWWPRDHLAGFASSGLVVPHVSAPPMEAREMPAPIPTARVRAATPVQNGTANARAPVQPARRAGRRGSYSPVEDDLIGQARVALRVGLVGEARSLLEQHLREFPKGQLADERDALLRSPVLH